MSPEKSVSTLAGKVALVTGAADGIGHAIAVAFAEAGAIVEASDIASERLAKRVSALSEAGLAAVASTCDVASTDSVRQWIESCVKRQGRIDILVNNAAIALSGNVTAMPESDWFQVLNTNLTSAFRTIQTALPVMIEGGGGSVVNIGSTQGHRSWNDWTAYAAAKGGLQSMTRQLAGQFGSAKVRFNVISPGAIDTPLNQRRAEEEGEAFVEASRGMHALERFGTPEEVAQAALFLASDAASFVTGHDLRVDGGLSALPRYCP